MNVNNNFLSNAPINNFLSNAPIYDEPNTPDSMDVDPEEPKTPDFMNVDKENDANFYSRIVAKQHRESKRSNQNRQISQRLIGLKSELFPDPNLTLRTSRLYRASNS